MGLFAWAWLGAHVCLGLPDDETNFTTVILARFVLAADIRTQLTLMGGFGVARVCGPVRTMSF